MPTNDNILNSGFDNNMLRLDVFESEISGELTADSTDNPSETVLGGSLESQNYIKDVSGYFLSEDNFQINGSINISPDGIELTKDGFIRTAPSGGRIEIIKNDDIGNFNNSLALYDNLENLLFRISNGGSPIMSIFGNNSFGCGQFLNSNSTAPHESIKATGAGLQDVVKIETSGSSLRSSAAALNIDNSSIKGIGINIKKGDGNTDALINIDNQSQEIGDLFVLKDNSFTATEESRITNENYIQFPAYYHCSDFDENISSNTSLSSTVISNAYWNGSGTNGTQILQSGVDVDEATACLLETTSTSNSTSTLTFGRYIAIENQACVEFRVQFKDSTNQKTILGFLKDATHLAYFETDTDADGTRKIYASHNNGSTTTTVDTGSTYNESLFIYFKIQQVGSKFYYFKDNILIHTATSNIPTSVHMKPYLYLDNKSASQNNQLVLDYVKIWSGRDFTFNFIP